MASGALNPIQNPNEWQNFKLGGVFSPGSIPANGVRGFKRSTGWDKKKGKGRKSATLTLTDEPPAEGTFTLQLHTAQDFADWEAFLPIITAKPDKKATQGIDIWYPSLADVDINAVVIQSIDPPKHVGKGLYIVEIEMIEWSPPPTTSIVQTPSSAVANGDASGPGDPTDPIEDQQQKEIAALLAEAQKP